MGISCVMSHEKDDLLPGKKYVRHLPGLRGASDTRGRGATRGRYYLSVNICVFLPSRVTWWEFLPLRWMVSVYTSLYIS